ncbi:MAG: DUF362 domain-containing protein [Deltaproteobacteria bacterium]|nr:DUF362 domain-containing protein [Deltaproteobacteria bacterium]
MQLSWTAPRGWLEIREAWTALEVRRALEDALRARPGALPADRGSRVLIKPNLNNDLIALTGNSADLRVLRALAEALRDRGYTRVALGDGSNVGVHRRGIDVARRLRVDRLAHRYGLRLVDLNAGEGVRVRLHGGAAPRISAEVVEAELLVSVPKVKTHAEVGFSGACKNLIGVVVGQDKRQIHLALADNIVALAELMPTTLVLVDGLVAMEGNGPGDGDPWRLGHLALSDRPWLVDAAMSRLAGLRWEQLPTLTRAVAQGHLDQGELDGLRARIAPARLARPAPPRGGLARASEHRLLRPLKLAVRPLLSPPVMEAAYRAGVVQDVYALDDDAVRGVVVADEAACTRCGACEAVCPDSLPLAEIGRVSDPARCLGCLYCWWVCPSGALAPDGPLGAMGRQVARYKRAVEGVGGGWSGGETRGSSSE